MESTPHWVLLMASIFSSLVNLLLRSYYSKNMVQSTRSYHLFNFCNSFVCGLFLLMMGGWQCLSVSLYTLLLGCAFGLIAMAQGLAHAAALHAGPVSYTTVIVSLSSIIPALSGSLFWQEKISLLQIFGMLLLVVCLVCSVNQDDGSAKASIRWLFLCILAFLGNGGVGVMQKIHQSSDFKVELNGFLVYACIFATVSAFVLFLITPQNQTVGTAAFSAKQNGNNPKQTLLLVGLFLVLGLTSALANEFNVYLTGVMPSAVFFPLVNGASLVMSTASGVVLFKERLSSRQWMGLAVGTAAVLCLCL